MYSYEANLEKWEGSREEPQTSGLWGFFYFWSELFKVLEWLIELYSPHCVVPLLKDRNPNHDRYVCFKRWSDGTFLLQYLWNDSIVLKSFLESQICGSLSWRAPKNIDCWLGLILTFCETDHAQVKPLRGLGSCLQEIQSINNSVKDCFLPMGRMSS